MLGQDSGQTQALLTLLTIDDELELHRYKHTQPNEPTHEYLDASFLKPRPPRTGKENHLRKHPLPKLNTSKEELKLILRRLESDQPTRKSEALHERALQPLRSSENEPKALPLKSFRECKEGRRKAGRTNEPRSQLSLLEGRAEEIQQLMRRNNYSANALNMKTLNILHEINSKNSRCSGVKRTPPDCKPIKKNLVTFLRKVASPT